MVNISVLDILYECKFLRKKRELKTFYKYYSFISMQYAYA